MAEMSEESGENLNDTLLRARALMARQRHDEAIALLQRATEQWSDLSLIHI